MTKAECKKRVSAAIKKLNDMEGHNLQFSSDEKEYGLFLFASQGEKHYGSLEIVMMFDDFAGEEIAREEFVFAVERMVAAAHLTDPKAYHNLAKGQNI